jgi:hypothetical protein
MSTSTPPPPPPPPAQRNGCITALMILMGAILLLPGICGVIIVGLDPRKLMFDQQIVLGLLALGGGGIALIWSAVGRPR